jgi:hypothetical protein
MKITYTQTILQYEGVDTAADLSVVAVKDGIAIGCIHKMSESAEGLPVLAFPDYVTFVSFFDEGVTFVHHAPVKAGTPWDGTNFVLPDTSGFEEIGTVVSE